jgi:hypothetical protein
MYSSSSSPSLASIESPPPQKVATISFMKKDHRPPSQSTVLHTRKSTSFANDIRLSQDGAHHPSANHILIMPLLLLFYNQIMDDFKLINATPPQKSPLPLHPMLVWQINALLN